MPTTGITTLTDHELARFAADSAGQRLLALRARLHAADAAELRAAGDACAQAQLSTLLTAHRPGDAVLSEEAVDSKERLGADRVWIIDPLDGTREFSEPPRDDWAVHVALWEAGRLTAGAVALPARHQLLSTGDGGGSVPPLPHRRPRMLVSRTRPPHFTEQLARALDAEVVPQGSAGVKAADVLLGSAELYVHAGGQYEWDSAAPVAVAGAWGFHTARLNGAALTYNSPDPLLPDLVVCHPGLASRYRSAFTALGMS
ncbi:3'(2'),5'-bisphosphate nucleotidase CysQ [Streptomyces sp. NPDC050095]|uniref:3'(2'),5'-bisphosphate nucleotidase CysQ n=1 Tax=unclassified Streptomyces TaxID=2593676 RepID=UPI00341602DD